MRNNPRNPVITHLIERSEGKRYSRIDNYLNDVRKREAEAQKLEEFRVKQVQLERKGGQWVEIRKGIRIFVHDGEDKDAKVERYKEKLRLIDIKNGLVSGTCKAKSFNE